MLHFDRCSVDVLARTVERDGVAQHLEPQAFDLLAYLMANADRVVPKTELLDEVWGDQFVSESALTTRIKEVRQALGDDGVRQSVVKNFRGRGYRFVAELRDPPESRPERPGSASSDALVGRAVDLTEASALLQTSRLVTLVGPGGVGKTSLAHELARRTTGSYPDGVRVVRLARVSDPASVRHVVWGDTELIEVGWDDEALIAALAELEALVLIDNCEHVLDAVSHLVAEVVERRGHVRFLATSRERLGVPGEQVWPVAPLDEAAAHELLLARARSVQPGFSWRAEHDVDITRIVRAVDRLPLAIEMAAARLPTIGVSELADVLTDRLDLLRSADRTAAERHRTIDALVGWSESLLGVDERELLAAMSVFAGPVTAADIAGVVGGESAELAVGTLAGLVDKSLAVVDTTTSPTTYRLLETVRARAARSRPAEVAAAHARHVAEVVAECDRRISTPDEPAAAARLEALTAEVRVAHAWARTHDPNLAGELTAALFRFAFEHQWAEPATWAAVLIEQPGLGDAGRLAALSTLASDASNRGDLAAARQMAALAATSTDPRVAAQAHDTLANTALYSGDLDAARRHGVTLLELGERLGDATVWTLGVLDEVLSFVYGGRVVEGQAALDRLTVGLDRRQLGPTSSAWIAYAAGELHAAAGRIDAAGEEFHRAIELASRVGSHFVVAVSRVSALAAATRAGDAPPDAFLPLLEQYRRTRSITHAVTTVRNLVEAMVDSGMTEPAMVLLGALSHPEVKSTYGAESVRVESARSAAIDIAGEPLVDAWMADGATHDAMWAIDYAIDVLAAGGRASDS